MRAEGVCGEEDMAAIRNPLTGPSSSTSCGNPIDVRNMTHESVTASTWPDLEDYRRDTIAAQMTSQQQSPLQQVTWNYFEAAQQKRSASCGSSCPRWDSSGSGGAHASMGEVHYK